jgi:hypothetical protein
LSTAHARLQHLQGADDAVTRGVAVQRQQMPRALATQHPVVAGQFLQHVAVAHACPHKLHTARLQRDFNGHVGHQGTNHAGHMLVTSHAIGRHEVKQLITVVETPGRVHHLQTVGIAVQCDAIVSMIGAHSTHQRVRMGGTDLVVDIDAVRSTPNRQHLSTQLMKHLGGHLVGSAMGRIHHNFEALEGQIRRKRALAKLNVPPCCIVESAGLAQRGRVSPLGRLLQRSFHRQLPRVRQLGALCTEKFDAVVRVSVVTGTDDHSQAGALRPRQICHTRSGQGPQQHHIDPRRVKTRLQCALEHVA